MKKVYLIILMILLPITVLAKGSISVSSNNVSVMNTKSTSFNVSSSNSAGKINISVADPTIAQVSLTGDMWIENESKVVTVKGLKEGKTTITITIVDVATFDLEELSGTYTVNVNVTPLVVEQKKEEYIEQIENKVEPEVEIEVDNSEEVINLVAKAEETNLMDDYEAALIKVNELDDGELKTSLLKRLDEVYFNIRLRDATDKYVCTCNEKGSSKYIEYVYIGLTILCILESVLLVYLVFKQKKNGTLK